MRVNTHRRFALVLFSCMIFFAVFSECYAEEPVTSIQDFNGKRIGVVTGSVHAGIVKEVLPSAEILYFDSIANLLTALELGKIDATVNDDTHILMLENTNPLFMHVGDYMTTFEDGFVFKKSHETDKLRKEINEFIGSIKADGTLKEIHDIWFSNDESKKTLPEYENYPDTNGILRVALDAENLLFSYVKDGRMAGYDVDILVRFCKAKGYKPEFSSMNFGAIVPSIVSGKCDIGIGAITITEERAESVNFSEPVYTGGAMLLALKGNVKQKPLHSSASNSETSGTLKDIKDLSGKRVAVVTGSTHPDITLNFVPSAELVYFDSVPDTFTALKSGKVDAVCTAIPMARLIMTEDDSIVFFGGQLTYTESAPIFAKTEKGMKLCEQFSEFFKAQWKNGTISELDSIWFGKDESRKVVRDYSNLPAVNGTLKMAADVSIPPCIYVKDNVIVGYDVDCAVRFCEAYGYGLEIVPMNFNGVIPSVQSGKCDFGMCGITLTDERKENVLFSYPNIRTGNAFVVRKSDLASEIVESGNSGRYTSIKELEGKRIGVQTGTRSPEIAQKFIPSAELVYYDTLADNLIALRTGKIDASCMPDISARLLMSDNDDIVAMGERLTNTTIASIFSKSEKGKKLCKEYSEFVKSLWDDGTMSKIASVWFSRDENKQILKDYTKLPATNGTLRMAVDSTMPPMTYVRDNRIVGYDIDIAVRFCEAKGYALKVIPMSFPAIIPAVNSEKCDFSCGMTYTPERAEGAMFSPTPNAETGSIILVRKSEMQGSNSGRYRKVKDLAGKKIGIILGANHDIFVAEKIPDAQIEYFNDLSAVTLALEAGKISAFTNTLPTAIYMTHEHKDMSYVSEPVENTFTYSAFTSSDKGHKICGEYSEFLKSLWNNGTIKRLSDKWIYNEDEKLRTLEDYSKLPAHNGVLRMAIDTGRMPFAYVKDNKITGYDIEIVSMFCRSKGYGLEVYGMDFAGILGSIKTGKCDLTGSITRTEERAETMLFSSVPNAETPIVLIVMKESEAMKPTETVKTSESESDSKSEINIFIEELKASFERTFIREDRWKLFVDGIISTMIITVLSILCGTVLGFVVYLSCRGGNIIANLITRFFVWLIQGMPMVVLLMILYYIIFGKVDIAGIWVAVIAFSLTFGAGMYEMLLSGVKALDKGQIEAAYALGFTDRRAFFTIILPQAALHFMPAYKAEVVALIKATAIVGYIAVQDLTKMGDIVRSRTYEAFFPLIAVAVIYFILAGMLNIIVGIIHNHIRPEKRTKNDILRGIEIHD